MRLSENQKNVIRLRIQNGVSNHDIANEFGVSVRTIQRIHKDMPKVTLPDISDYGEDGYKIDTLCLLSPKEQNYVKKLKEELWKYEDEASGYFYHLRKESIILRTSGTWWSAIVYPDSAPKDWKERLLARGFSFEVSPLHDKDFRKFDNPRTLNPKTGEIIKKGELYRAGDRMKEHYHLLIHSEKSIQAVYANEIIRGITNGPYIQKCDNPNGYHDYLTHKFCKPSEGKYLYDESEIETWGNFSLKPTEREIKLMENIIYKTITKESIETWHELIKFFENQPEYIHLLTNKPSSFRAAVNSMWNMNHPKGRHLYVSVSEERLEEIMKEENHKKNRRK